MSSLKLIRSYLTKRKHRLKINDTYSSWTEIPFGVPGCSIPGSVLFHIRLCVLFIIVPNYDIAK